MELTTIEWILGLTILNTIMIIYGRTRDYMRLIRLLENHDKDMNHLFDRAKFHDDMLERIDKRIGDIKDMVC